MSQQSFGGTRFRRRSNLRGRKREVKVPGTRDGSERHEPSGCAHDAESFIMIQDRAELELEELRDVPDKGENLSDTVVKSRNRREEVHGRLRD